jgi:hypothetical protein
MKIVSSRFHIGERMSSSIGFASMQDDKWPSPNGEPAFNPDEPVY